MSLESFSKFLLKTNQQTIRENYNPDVLNAMVKKIEQNIADIKATKSPKLYVLTKEEYAQLKALEAVAKERVLKIIDTKFSKEWPEYRAWEKDAERKGYFLNFARTNIERLPPNIKVSTIFKIELDDEITIPHDFYNLLLWRYIIRQFARILQKGADVAQASDNEIQSSIKIDIYYALKRLPKLVKSTSSTIVPEPPSVTKP